MKRLLPALLALCMLMTYLSFAASAGHDTADSTAYAAANVHRSTQSDKNYSGEPVLNGNVATVTVTAKTDAAVSAWLAVYSEDHRMLGVAQKELVLNTEVTLTVTVPDGFTAAAAELFVLDGALVPVPQEIPAPPSSGSGGGGSTTIGPGLDASEGVEEWPEDETP